MKPSWLHGDLSLPVDAPIKNEPGERSAGTLIRVVTQVEVATSERYKRRDLTGDGRDETFCNFFVCDVTRALGCPLPQQRANDTSVWLEQEGAKRGWWRVGLELAHFLSSAGGPVVVSWRNPNAAAPGHVALLVPPLNDGLWIAQAGSTNFDCRPIADGFGLLKPELWGHA